jgi:hypothetical protein
MFRITDGKGFHIKFANGYTLSVQFGPSNYCQRRKAKHADARSLGAMGSIDAEIAVVAPDGAIRKSAPHDTVRGYVSPDEVARIMQIVATDPLSLVVANEAG